jgi:hypothetical protein
MQSPKVNMRTLIRLAMLFATIISSVALAQETSHGDFRFFGTWKSIPTKDEKAFVYMGFINGYFAGERTSAYDVLAGCIDKKVSAEQAIAMIDKYSTDNPQRWTAPLPMGIIEALTVKDGPCPDLNPVK